jgi:hypothetical protein
VATTGQTDGLSNDQATERGAFITYAWESAAHREWTERLAERLHVDGVPIILDKWHLELGDSLTQFMERAIRDSQYVLVVCTPEYKRRSDERLGGVGYEGHVMTAEVLSKNPVRKFIPVLARGTKDTAIPTSLAGRMFADLSAEVGTSAFESQYEELRAFLLGRRKGPPPAGQPSTHPPVPAPSLAEPPRHEIPVGRADHLVGELAAGSSGVRTSADPTDPGHAEQRAERLGAMLARTAAGTTARRDAVREALEVVAAAVEALATAGDAPAGVAAPSGREFHVTPDFLSAVDEVLAGTLPLLKAEDEGLEDAQATLLDWLDVDAEQSRADAFLQAVASVAMHLLAAAAWRWRRGSALGWCVEQLAGRYRHLVYLHAFEGWSNRSARAVEQVLRESRVISRIAPEVRDAGRGTRAAGAGRDPEEPPAALLCVVGLIAMRGVWFGRVAEISAALKRGEKPPMVDWPAFQHEYRAWVDVLPDQLRRSPRWERDVSSMALDVADVDALRRYWAKNGPVLALLFANAYSLRHRDASGWRREHLSEAWLEWAGRA